MNISFINVLVTAFIPIIAFMNSSLYKANEYIAIDFDSLNVKKQVLLFRAFVRFLIVVAAIIYYGMIIIYAYSFFVKANGIVPVYHASLIFGICTIVLCSLHLLLRKIVNPLLFIKFVKSRISIVILLTGALIMGLLYPFIFNLIAYKNSTHVLIFNCIVGPIPFLIVCLLTIIFIYERLYCHLVTEYSITLTTGEVITNKSIYAFDHWFSVCKGKQLKDINKQNIVCINKVLAEDPLIVYDYRHYLINSNSGNIDEKVDQLYKLINELNNKS